MKLFSIPSPGDPFLFRFHGLQARWYGLILALAVLLAGWIARKEFRRRKIDPELVYTIAVWTVPFGLVAGAAVPRGHRLGRILARRTTARSPDLAGRPRHLGCRRSAAWSAR